ncbi:MAG: hypothetical protein C0593_14320 [Marinilabiliales bacterium]|nr:MAG: hypothetical protein C0593_14320 [Marinilabiliales bacterium]
MKKLLLSIILIIATVATIAQESDKEAIKQVIQTAYVEGIQNEGNIEKIDSGIHPEFRLVGIGEGDEMWILPIREWKESVKKKVKEGKLPRTGQDKVSVDFIDIDITGRAAMVKLNFYLGKQLRFIDYIGLYKFESGWMMVSKTYEEM